MIQSDRSPSGRMPVLFIGHGSPMNAVYDNSFTRSLSSLGSSLRSLNPLAVLVVSAHWLTNGTRVSVNEKPKTIHDFGGFPEELYTIEYPAPGADELARETVGLIRSVKVAEDSTWGLDHGAWTVLRHMFPGADIPVYQVSIDYHKPAEHHFAIGEDLKPLRERGVLIIGSGNIVHNLYTVDYDEHAQPFPWAIEFDEIVKSALLRRDFETLVDYPGLGNTAMMAIPTNDHYLPMLYSLGAADREEALSFTHEEIQNGSISMRCFRIG